MPRANIRTTLCRAIATVIVVAASGSPSYSQTAQRSSVDIQQIFTPSGWMGDGEYTETRDGAKKPKYITFSAADHTLPHTRNTSIKISYAFGPKSWGGMYWQNLPDNWGDRAGSNYSGRGFSRVTFWARGETGSEVVEFKVGGIDDTAKRYRDSFVATAGSVSLSKEWTQYSIDLSDKNLSSVIGGFCWVASAANNSGSQITFYLEDIRFQ